MKILLYLSFLILPFCAYAQKGSIKGRILDKTSGKTLEAASISAVGKKDSSLLAYTFSNGNGEFTLNGLPVDQALDVFVSYKGFRDTVVFFSSVGTGYHTWPLTRQSIDLKEVEISARKPPFQMRNDTLEFDATVLKLLPNAAVKDLLKKLPGVMIDQKGHITVNGKKATKIQVDGRDFFSGNLLAATENLPGDMIEKVQVTETRSLEQQRSLAVRPPSEDVTINLKLRKNKKNGLFGNASAGIGTDSRYSGNASVNSFGDPARLSFYGSAGNASNGDAGAVIATVGPSSGFSGGGITDAQSTGLNLNTKYGKKVSIDANYNFSRSETRRETIRDRLNLLPDSSFWYNSHESELDHSRNHSLSVGITYERDSFTVLTVRPTVQFGDKRGVSFINAGSHAMTSGNVNDVDQWGFGNELSFNKTSKDRKVNLNVTWRVGVNNRVDRQVNNSSYDLDMINQHSFLDEETFNNNATFSLSGKLGGRFVAALEYTLDHNKGSLLRETFSSGSKLPDSTLSGNNKNTNTTQVPSAQIAYKGERLSIALNAGVRFMQQENKLLWKDSGIVFKQRQFSPNLQMNYTMGQNGHLGLGYTVSSTAPTTEQLAPAVDKSNPLYIRLGNPALKTGIIHSFYANMFRYVPQKGIGMNIMGNGTFMHNQIVNDVFYDTSGRQVSTYRNVSGGRAVNLIAMLNGTRKWKNWNVRGGLNVGGTNNREIGFVEKQRNESQGWRANGYLDVSVSWKELYSISLSAENGWNTTTYSLPGLKDVSYNTQGYAGQLQVTSVKRMEISCQMNYRYNSEIRGVMVWNSAVAYRFLKKEQLTLRLSVNDLFNGNSNISRTTGPAFIENLRVNALQRYGMLTLKYNFNRFAETMAPAAGAIMMR